MFSIVPLPARKRLDSLIQVGKKVFHYGYIPVVLYLGFKKGSDKGMPELTLLSLLWQ
jgi:import receptor subunit TOM7